MRGVQTGTAGTRGTAGTAGTPRVAIAISVTVLLILGVGIVPGRVSAVQQPTYDLVIQNALVVDGTGTPGRVMDIAIKDGRIARVGPLGTAGATARLDARGLVAAPGFIDVHTHADDLATRPQAENFIRMGVTSIVAGNCGSSALAVGEAFDRIREATVAVNFATLIGHNTVRTAVMGRAERAPALAELDRMKSLIYTAMVDGAVGFSTGLQYVPGTYARSNEIIELARVAANEGGLYATHMRNEGTDLEASVRESINVARTLDIGLQISHLKVDSPNRWGASAAALALIDEARARGLRVEADQYAYSAASSSPRSGFRRGRSRETRRACAIGSTMRWSGRRSSRRCRDCSPNAGSRTCRGPRWRATGPIRR